ncbi:DUF4062 domain-containing protein [Candidatus Uabimicrobium amorphum]|uniref:DUF4062 domain-containing protein n=1 Tax=Uabimicrobium amorphum TaxID=2596890 RepID=A0A5S9F3I8_UABAM|nr:DUF4062 domain-containing protein [Candidatus Uabimicrobium amorphum]BBM84301.1 hypothetical protein UABAM_02658 [Candidatus Uabimicrobium amorphum]
MLNTWKMLKVFVSSTFLDLELERDRLHQIFEKIEQKILHKRLTICSYDLRWRDRSSTEHVVDWCIRMVEQCDYFIAILGNRYGWIPEKGVDGKQNKEGYSVTEMEIRKALEIIPKERRFFCFTQGEEKSGDNVAATTKLKQFIQNEGETVFHCDNVAELLDNVTSHFQKVVNSEYPNAPQSEEQQSYRDILRNFLAEKVHRFCGRKEYLRSLHEFVDANDRQNYLCIEAVAGTGKSALLAKFICERGGTKIPIVAHFMGMGRDSRQISGIVHNIAEQLKVWNILKEVPSDLESLQLAVKKSLEAYTQPLILIVDGLDEVADNGRDLLWLPRSLPQNIRIILSSRPADTLDRVQDFPFVTTKQLMPLSMNETNEIIEIFSQKHRLNFSTDDKELLRKRASGNPLYLKVALEEVATSGIAVGQLAVSIEALFEQVLERLEKDFSTKFPSLQSPAAAMIQTYLGLIAAGENGVLEKEVKDILSVGDDFVMLARKSLRTFVVQRQNFLNFFHPQFELAIKMRLGKSGMRNCHKKMAAYLHKKGHEYYRTLEELPFQLQWAEEYEQLLEVLTQFDFLQAKCNAHMVAELKNDLDFALNGQVVKLRQSSEFEMAPQVRVNREIISLMNRAIGIDGQFLQDHPQCLLQTLWNYGYWHDHHDAQQHFTKDDPTYAWNQDKPKFHLVVEHWRQNASSSSPWLRAIRPLPTRLDSPVLNIFQHEQPVTGIDISSDGTKAASGSYDCTLRVWDIHTNKILLEHTYEAPVNDVRFSPDGSMVYSAGLQIDVWDVSQGEKIKSLGEENVLITKMTLSANGELLAVATADNRVVVYNTISKQQVACFADYSHAISNLSISSDLKFLASGDYGNSMKIWDLQSRELVTSYESEGIISDVDFHPGNKKIAISTHIYFQIWDMEAQKIVHSHNLGAAPMSITYSSDGETLAIGAQQIFLFDTKEYKQQAVLEGHDSIVGSVHFTPDGKKLISGSMDKTVRLWSTKVQGTSLQAHEHKFLISDMAISEDAHFVASGSYDQFVMLWDGITGKRITQFSTGVVSCLLFSPCNTLLIIGTHDNKIHLWNLESQTLTCTLSGHSQSISSLAMSGNTILSGSEDGSIFVWSAKEQQCIHQLDAHDIRVVSLEFTDDNTVVSHSYIEKKVWSADNYECLEKEQLTAAVTANTGTYDVEIDEGVMKITINGQPLFFPYLENVFCRENRIIGNSGNYPLIFEPERIS